MSVKNPVLEKMTEISDFVIEMREKQDKDITELRERLEGIEALRDRPSLGTKDGNFTADEREHKDIFTKWLRRPGDASMQRQLAEAQSELERKTVTVNIGTSADGGYAVPAIIATAIESRVVQQNPFRSLVRVDQAGSSSYTALVSRNSAGSGWVGEAGSRTATDASTLIECAPTFGTVYAFPSATEESMQDIFFDVGAWLTQEAADAFSAAEATAIVSGSGSSQPSGFLHTSPASTDDGASPERAVTALEYLPMTANSASPYAFSADDLIALSMSLKDGYYLGGNVAWVMRRSTAAVIRKLKDSYGQYLLQTSLVQGTPDMLLGYPVKYTDAMPAHSAGNYPIAFGNWSRGYLLADRVGSMAITVDSNISTPGYVKFYMRRRVGGKVLNNEAVKVLKYAAS